MGNGCPNPTKNYGCASLLLILYLGGRDAPGNSDEININQNGNRGLE